jgi:hypothetical protein
MAHLPALVLSRAWTSSLSWVRMWGFRPYSIKLLAHSTYPCVIGWASVAQSTQILLSSQKSKNLSSVN